MLSRVRHPNIVRFLGSGKVPRKFLVLELLSGGSLSHALGLRADSRNQTWEKRFTFLETLDFALSLARALKYLHHDWSPAVHIIHRYAAACAFSCAAAVSTCLLFTAT